MKRAAKLIKWRRRNIVVLIVALYGLNYFLLPVIVGEKLETYFRPKYDRPFDSEIWKQAGLGATANTNQNFGLRYEMLDNLISTKLSPSVEEVQLDSLLGNPDSIAFVVGDKCLFYALGDQRQYPAKSILFPFRFSNFDRWMLEIRLRNGRIASWKIFYT